MSYTSDKRLYLTREGEVVEEGDERAATLLVGAGGQLSDEQAAQYGLTGKREAAPQEAPKHADHNIVQPGAPKQRAPQSKAVSAPEGNK